MSYTKRLQPINARQMFESLIRSFDDETHGFQNSIRIVCYFKCRIRTSASNTNRIPKMSPRSARNCVTSDTVAKFKNCLIKCKRSEALHTRPHRNKLESIYALYVERSLNLNLNHLISCMLLRIAWFVLFSHTNNNSVVARMKSNLIEIFSFKRPEPEFLMIIIITVGCWALLPNCDLIFYPHAIPNMMTKE